MIPDKKKTPQEIESLREELGTPEELPKPPAHQPSPRPPFRQSQKTSPKPSLQTSAPLPVNPDSSTLTPPRLKPIQPAPVSPIDEPDPREQIPKTELREVLVHLDVPKAPTSEASYRPVLTLHPSHSLRKHELPLASAPKTPDSQKTELPTHHKNTATLAPAPQQQNSPVQKTNLPTHRHDPKNIAEIRRREELAKLNQPSVDPVFQLRKITANPILLTLSYLLSLAPALLVYKEKHFIIPLGILGICVFITTYIFLRKKRSRHHAAILTIIILMTLVFGGLHYAPHYNYGS